MNIKSVEGSSSYTRSYSSDNKVEVQSKKSLTDSQGLDTHSKVDVRNISIEDINRLIKSGENKLLDVVPFISPDVLQDYDNNRHAIKHIKINLMDQVEKSIEFNKSIGKETHILEGVFNRLNEIDGTDIYSAIEVKA